VQDALRRIVEIVELPAAHGVHEQPSEDRAEQEGHRQQKDYRVQASSSRTSVSTREAPQMTIPLESGINTAATSGLTSPATAALTAMAL
jgi:hypothetical protein